MNKNKYKNYTTLLQELVFLPTHCSIDVKKFKYTHQDKVGFLCFGNVK